MKLKQVTTIATTTICCSILIAALLLISGCDTRSVQKPKLILSAANSYLYGADDNLKSTTITFSLTGSSSFIQNERINVEYRMGTFVGALSGGDATSVVTNKNGVATGQFILREDAVGVISFKATMRRFKDVTETIPIYAFEIPAIEITASETLIGKNESINLTVKLSDSQNNIENIADRNIIFTTNRGLLTHNKVTTDNNGRAVNHFNAGDQTGTATIRASLEMSDRHYEEIRITIVETTDEPFLSLEVDNNRLYGEGVQCNINKTNITFILEGVPAYTHQAKIMLQYDKSKGTFAGTNSEDFIITDNSGIAVGVYTARSNAVGAATFTARHEVLPSVTQYVNLYHFDLPTIQFTAEDTQIGVNDSTLVVVQLTDVSMNVDNKTIVFTSNSGRLAHQTVVTDSDGRAENVFYGHGQAGPATIKAALQICPDRFKEILINRN